MADAMNIQSMLDAGYFTTSRARSNEPRPPPVDRGTFPHSLPLEPVPPPVPVHSQVPRTVYLAPAPADRRAHPPPPTAEDEAESLAREHGPTSGLSTSDEEPPSRGEIDQCPIIMEVHEHNPERRFVIVAETAKDQEPIIDDAPSQDGRASVEEEEESPALTRPPRSGNIQNKETADLSRYGLDRRQSQQVLTPLHTDLNGRRAPSGRSPLTPMDSRPDYFSPRQARTQKDHSPYAGEFSSVPTGREKAHRGTEQAFTVPGTRPSPRWTQRPRSRDGGASRGRHEYDWAPSSARPYVTGSERSQPRRRMTNDAEPRYRDEMRRLNGEPDDRPQLRGRSDASRAKGSPRASRHLSRPREEYPQLPNGHEAPSSKPIVVQETKPKARQERKSEKSGRSRSSSRNRFAASATTAAGGGQAMYETNRFPPRSPAEPIIRQRDSPNGGTRSQLPYPDDDHPHGVGLGIQPAGSETRYSKYSQVYMPELPPFAAKAPDRSLSPLNGIGTAPPTPAAAAIPRTWSPGVFDPQRDGAPADRPIGTYRRYSENQGKDHGEILPECPRQERVAGMVDWLTLPHTRFNICPSCYDTVFAKSQYRALFKPTLWPSNEPIACDFGVSPWYRIAWLLTIKEDIPDLRLLERTANLISTLNREPCPGPNKVSRNWLTVADSYTRKPVADFAVCYQCASIVELLLPNLTGVFEPLDPLPSSGVCDLHFTPDRKEFTLFFDALETTSEKAMQAKRPPNVDELARKLWSLTAGDKCREDTPVLDGYWHTMQFLRDFTVCEKCFDDVVEPKLADGNFIAQNFYQDPQRLPSATCQLYSARMREIFKRSCRRNDPVYLEEKVLQRRRKEKEIYEQLVKLDRSHSNSAWKEDQVGKLIDEWKRWE
ncbi:hypothetical protein AAL_03523 [Moelleriella libera RCEF 2490]|uniref:Uncharacterized protein n=1 Tax=Moelleriella libera RCEF 2490 TaxID=1081109 RepID=A0A168DB77_9HYPO|nr:hypothetical protein AAL_03523 [Moelleriella libera RCEF 2490]